MGATPASLPAPAAPADRAHLVFLGHGAERTGPPILLAHLLRGLAADRTLRCSVLVARAGPLEREYGDAGAATRALTKRREPLEPLAAGLRRAGAGCAVAPLQDLVRSVAARRTGAADLVYVNGATPATAALLRGLRVPDATPVIVHVHELGVGLELNLDPGDRDLLLARADHLISASAPVSSLLIDRFGVAADRLTLCPEFVDVDVDVHVTPGARASGRGLLAIPDEAVVVASVGLPDWRKDPEHLLRAVAIGRRRHPDFDPWVLWIGGDPASDDSRHLADEARRLGLGHRFVHHPHTHRATDLLAAVDVFALPAREDAMPLAALEAAAAALPIVCFDTGGIAGLTDRGAGVTVDYPDTAAFAEALVALVADPDRRVDAGRTARTLAVDEHSIEVGTARIAEVIRTALSPPGRRSRAKADR